MIRPCLPTDAPQISEIYNYYVRNTIITFEEADVTEAEMARRIAEIQAHLPWLVWEEEDAIGGYAYAAPWKARSAYRFSVETTIYLSPSVIGRGIGTQLYGALLAELRERGIHCAIGGIALPNAASVVLHERLGFTKVAQFKEVGRKLGKWIDVGYWELLL